jgi:competence transcription factor ComK
MNFIKLISRTGQLFLVNLSKVRGIYETDGTKTQIFFSENDYMIVDILFEDFQRMLEAHEVLVWDFTKKEAK